MCRLGPLLGPAQLTPLQSAPKQRSSPPCLGQSPDHLLHLFVFHQLTRVLAPRHPRCAPHFDWLPSLCPSFLHQACCSPLFWLPLLPKSFPDLHSPSRMHLNHRRECQREIYHACQRSHNPAPHRPPWIWTLQWRRRLDPEAFGVSSKFVKAWMM